MISGKSKSRRNKLKTKKQKYQEVTNPETNVKVPKGKVDVVADFIADFWKVVTPEMLNCLENMLVADIGFTSEETEEIINNLKEIGNQKCSYEKQYEEKRIVRVGPRNQWIKEVSKTVADQIAMVVVGTLLSTSTDRTKRLSEKIYEHLSILTEENITPESATSRIQRAMVVLGDSMAKWIDGALSTIEQRTKCSYDIMSRPSTPECTVASVVLSESDDELEDIKHPPYPFYQYMPIYLNPIPFDQGYSQSNTKETEEQLRSMKLTTGEGNESEQQEEETYEEQNQLLQYKEQDHESTNNTNDKNDDLVSLNQSKERKSSRKESLATTSGMEEDSQNIMMTDLNEENKSSSEEKNSISEEEENTINEEEKIKEESKEEDEVETVNGTVNSSIGFDKMEEVDVESEEVEEDIENKEKEEYVENMNTPTRSPSIITLKNESITHKSSVQKEMTDIFNLLKEDMQRLPKDKTVSTRQKTVKENVYERFKNIAEEKNNTSLDTLMRRDISEAASIAANWIESVLPPADTSTQSSFTVRKSSAFEIKHYGSKYKALKLSYNTVAQKVADLRGLDHHPRKDKPIPETMSPMNVKYKNDWVDWALGATNIGKNWGTWLDTKVSHMEHQLEGQIPKSGKDRNQSWTNWKVKAEREALTWQAENKRLMEEAERWKRKLHRGPYNTSEREIKTLTY